MSQIPNDIEELSPYKLLGNFSRNRILPCILLALLIHVLVIGGTSYNFIYYTWIDPDAKPAQSDAAGQGDEPAEESPSSETGSAKSGAAGNTAGAGDTAADSSAPAGGNADSPVVKSITEEAKPDEIPSEPDGFGISIEDTNR